MTSGRNKTKTQTATGDGASRLFSFVVGGELLYEDMIHRGPKVPRKSYGDLSHVCQSLQELKVLRIKSL